MNTLKKLGKDELLEIMREQELEIKNLTDENERLARRAEELEEQLKNAPPAAEVLPPETVTYKEYGSLAEMAFQVQGIFETAQKTADQYINEIIAVKNRMSGLLEAREAEANAKAGEIIAAARAECVRYERERDAIVAGMWQDIEKRLDDYYEAHKGLKELLGDLIKSPRWEIGRGYEE